MKCPRVDFHIHTRYLGCANETMEVPAIAAMCRDFGVKAIAITDHLNTVDKLELHKPILADIRALETDVQVFFGVELNFLEEDGGFAYSEEIRDEYGFQFAIGGIHSTYLKEYNIKELVDIQHRHHLKTCENPLVDVLVHPYWFGKREFERNGWPWFETMRVVPESCAKELGQAARETGTAIEINAAANLTNPAYSERFVEEYFEYMSIVAQAGACFTVGSDAHDIGDLQKITAAWDFAERLGISEDRIWLPDCAPIIE